MASVLPLEPPQRLVRALERDSDGPAHDWLAGLPDLLDRWLERWQLTPDRVATPGGRTSLVVLVRQSDGVPATLKLPVPRTRSAGEAVALRHWDGRSAVRLLRVGGGGHANGQQGHGAPSGQPAQPAEALLLERLHTEISLRSLPEAKAVLEAGSVVRRLWVAAPAGGGLPTVAERTGQEAATLRDLAGAEVRPLLEQALELRDGLVGDAAENLLLHGDYRQGAVLAADAERARWLAVGPEPVVGERAYDLARLVRDRLHDLVASPSAPMATRRRVTRLAEALEVDPERLRGWTVYRAVESGVRQLAAGHREDGETLLEFASWL